MPAEVGVDDLMDVPPVAKAGDDRRPAVRAVAFRRAIAAILIPMPVAAVVAYSMTHLFKDYGWSLFVAMPFVMPMISVILYGYRRSSTYGESPLVGMCWLWASLSC